MRRYTMLLGLLIVFLAACVSSKSSKPDNSINVLSATNTSSTTPTYSDSASLTPPPTLLFLETSTPTPRATAAYATLNAVSRLYEVTPPHYLGCYDISTSGLSPDGKWATLDKVNYVFRTDGSSRWDLQPFIDSFFSQFPHLQESYQQQLSFLTEHWSLDRNYLYFILCDFRTQEFDRSLYRLDLRNGNIANMYIAGERAFSPDDQYVVYNDNCTVRLRSLQTEHENYWDLHGYFSCGKFIWSPDSRQVAFTAIKYMDQAYDPDGWRFIFLWNVEDDSIQTLMEAHGLETDSWVTPEMIKLVHWGSNPFETLYDLSQHKLFLLSPAISIPAP
jgi:hypothetical protein